MSEGEAELIRLASPMHDIGKLAIPDEILNKPGKLTNEEFEVIKTHSVLGYDMLKNSDKAIMKAAATIALEHHEKFDGTGYPIGLRGDNIHIYGRITAVADVFDALGSDRVYKKAWPLNDILELSREERGRHFDPVLVDILFGNLEEFLIIKESLADTD
jgi:response regulator RpfG family c-di-GMP phosphodiesterase